jgi:hypothetical protein
MFICFTNIMRASRYFALVLLFAAVFTGCGGDEDKPEDLTESVEASSDIEEYLSETKYTKSSFAAVVERDGIHKGYEGSKWTPNDRQLADQLYQAMESETEVVFTGKWGSGETTGSFYQNGFWGIVWQYSFNNPNCAEVGGSASIPHFVEVSVESPTIHDLNFDSYKARLKELRLDGKEVILVGKIKSVTASGGESACKNGWLRIELDRKGGKVFDVQAKQRVL